MYTRCLAIETQIYRLFACVIFGYGFVSEGRRQFTNLTWLAAFPRLPALVSDEQPVIVTTKIIAVMICKSFFHKSNPRF